MKCARHTQSVMTHQKMSPDTLKQKMLQYTHFRTWCVYCNIFGASGTLHFLQCMVSACPCEISVLPERMVSGMVSVL